MKPTSLYFLILLTAGLIVSSCNESSNNRSASDRANAVSQDFNWKTANVYFLLTDRFNKGNSETGRTDVPVATATLRGFEGGNLNGITEKLNEGYFEDLGVDAIWMTPFVRQIDAPTDEGTGVTYGYHGYWAKDWTSLDPNFGTYDELKELVDTAHSKGIKIVMDAVLNHTGPVTDKDPVFPEDWVRQTPPCDFSNYAGTVECTLVANLPDIRTESTKEVELPESLVNLWKEEGRLDSELAELDSFFARTNLPKTPRNYLIKWLTDYVRELGIDGFRVDTTKHVDEATWAALKQEANYAFQAYHDEHQTKPSAPFYMVGEVYFYGIGSGPIYDFGDRQVNYFDFGFDALINFDLRSDATESYEYVFSKYDSLLNKVYPEVGILSYLSSHDDSSPFDRYRETPIKAANTLLLNPGGIQIYYGDETMRPLEVEGAVGDANLRSFMNWEALESDSVSEIHKHWQKLGRFRQSHPAVGGGRHQKINDTPYFFTRIAATDAVIVGLELSGPTTISLPKELQGFTTWQDAYTGNTYLAKNGNIELNTTASTALLSPVR